MDVLIYNESIVAEEVSGANVGFYADANYDAEASHDAADNFKVNIQFLNMETEARENELSFKLNHTTIEDVVGEFCPESEDSCCVLYYAIGSIHCPLYPEDTLLEHVIITRAQPDGNVFTIKLYTEYYSKQTN